MQAVAHIRVVGRLREEGTADEATALAWLAHEQQLGGEVEQTLQVRAAYDDALLVCPCVNVLPAHLRLCRRVPVPHSHSAHDIVRRDEHR